MRWRQIEAEFGVKLYERTVGTGLAKPGFRRLSVRPEHPNVDTGAMDPFLLRLTFAAVYRICHGVLNGKSKREPGIIWIRIRLQLAHSKNISAILEKSGRPASQ